MNIGRGLLPRLAVLGLLQLCVLSVAVLAISIFTSRPPPDGAMGRLALESLAERVAARLQKGENGLSEELVRLRERYAMDLTLYDANQGVVASSLAQPLPLPDGRRPRRGQLPKLIAPPKPTIGASLRVRAGQGLLVGRAVSPPPSLVAPLLMLIAGLSIVVLGAVFSARLVVGPLQLLARTARALGRGDLTVQTGFRRGDEIGELAQAFDDMAGRIRVLLRAEKELLANVSHEFKTPLARIRVALELAEEGDAEQAREALSEITVDLGELEQLVEDVLMSARVDVASLELVPSSFRLRRAPVIPLELVSLAAERFRARHPTRSVSQSVERGLPALELDKRLFRRVLDNLLENAHRYTPNPEAGIDVLAENAEGGVAFVVEDRGVGMSSEDLDHAFEPFFRAERSRSRQAGGTGLGLTLVKRIVEAHGGRVTLHSALGEGLTVRIFVPLLESAVASNPNAIS